MTLGPAPKTGDRAAYDIIFLDPPYGTGAGGVALDKLLRLGWIDEATWISLETGVKDDVKVRGLTVEATRKVGKAQITLLRMAPTSE